MGDHGHAFAIGVAAGVAASILAWKCLGSDKLAASFARPGAAATLKTGREAAPPASGGGVTGGKEGSTVPMTEVLDDEVLKEQLTRNIQFFGEKAQLDLANAFVVVVGLGVSVRRESIVADPAVTDGLASLSLPSRKPASGRGEPRGALFAALRHRQAPPRGFRPGHSLLPEPTRPGDQERRGHPEGDLPEEQVRGDLPRVRGRRDGVAL